jgi:hypothetical protein
MFGLTTPYSLLSVRKQIGRGMGISTRDLIGLPDDMRLE